MYSAPNENEGTSPTHSFNCLLQDFYNGATVNNWICTSVLSFRWRIFWVYLV